MSIFSMELDFHLTLESEGRLLLRLNFVSLQNFESITKLDFYFFFKSKLQKRLISRLIAQTIIVSFCFSYV